MAGSEIQNNIRKLRFDSGQMTQQQLADRVGVTRQTIIAIEAGKYSPSLTLAFKIAQVFSLKIEDIFQFNNDLPTINPGQEITPDQ
ncbi:MAG: helix-turn-helix transcriptional regulator [Planctomycetota bacterium]|jgi:putative transcriptional regulator